MEDKEVLFENVKVEAELEKAAEAVEVKEPKNSENNEKSVAVSEETKEFAKEAAGADREDALPKLNGDKIADNISDAVAYSEGEAQEEPEDQNAEEKDVTEEILDIILSDKPESFIRSELDNYHENDMAEALTKLSKGDRIRLYRILGNEKISEIFAYLDDVSDYLEELGLEKAADVIENMDADDAVDVLEEIEDDETREQIISLMEPEASEDIRLITSYDDDKIGSMMTTNYVSIPRNATVKSAMRSLIEQAGENDNINTIYVYDEEEKYYGAIELRDLIVARKDTDLEAIISTGYPCINANEKISDSIEDLKAYAEDSLPVVDDDRHIIGVITSTDIVEAVDDELGEDYAKLAGLTEEADINEKITDSMRKRLPWLVLLLLLAMGVSGVVGLFENVVKEVAIIVSFQSLILGMAGNVGTQSLAVTIRVLMDGNISAREKAGFIFKEMRVGAFNGLLLGTLAFVAVGAYMHFVKEGAWGYSFAISGCVGMSLCLAMIISSFVGAAVPMLLQKLKFDPAVASGPLITTMNDLVAVVTYYSLANLLLIHLLGL
ncbi:MAG: magnesium transporter [Lachnospiraceae bacterium]|nr:magnesium transporter [Lachnospiraceae bacterium]